MIAPCSMPPAPCSLTAAEAIEKHRPLLLWISSRYRASVDLPMEEMMQIAESAFAVAWDKARPDCNERQRVGYASTAAKNAFHTILNYRKAQKRDGSTISLDAPLPGQPDLTLHDMITGTNGGWDDLKDHVSAALSALPPETQTLIHQYFYERRTLEEIGEMEGLTRAGIRARLLSAYAKLRPLLFHTKIKGLTIC